MLGNFNIFNKGQNNEKENQQGNTGLEQHHKPIKAN